MAILISQQSGNFTQSIWWQGDVESHLDSKGGTYITSTVYRTGSSFAPGALVITGSALFIANHTKSLGGNLQFELYNTSSLVSVAGTYVELNNNDVPDQGWIFVYYTSSVTLAAATNYCFRVKSSISGAYSLYTSAVAGNFSRILITTASRSASSADAFFIGGTFFTGSDMQPTQLTITMSLSSSTAYGVRNVNSSSFSVNGHGTVTFLTSSNTLLTLSSSIDIYSSGTLNIGTSDYPIPSGSRCNINLQQGSAACNFGINVYRQGVLNIYGRPITNPYTFLESELTASSFAVTCSSTTDWNVGDQIVVGSSTRTYSQYETGSITEISSPTTFKVAQKFIYGHSGSSFFKTEIINRTRNVKIYGQTSALPSYIYAAESAIVNINGAEIYWMGSSASPKWGFQSDQDWRGILNITNSSFHLYDSVTGTRNYQTRVDTAFNFYKNVYFSMRTFAWQITSTSSYAIIDGDCSIGTALGSANSGALQISSLFFNGIIKNIILSSGQGYGIYSTTYCNSVLSNLNIHSISSAGIGGLSATSLKIKGLNCWYINTVGLFMYGGQFEIDSASFIGNGTTHFYIRQVYAQSSIKNSIFNGTSLFSTAQAIMPYQVAEFPNIMPLLKLENCTFGSSSGILTSHTVADIRLNTPNFPNYVGIVSENCSFNSETECVISSSSDMPSFCSIQSGSILRTYVYNGLLSKDTTNGLFVTSQSLRMTPSLPATSSVRLKSYVGYPEGCGFGRYYSVVPSGSSAYVSIKVRESVAGDGTAYNGQYARLLVEKSVVAGIYSDTVIATASVASEGNFETIGGYTPVVKNNCVLNYYVDCGGDGYTGGWINVDDFNATAVDSRNTSFWNEGGPFMVSNNISTGSSAMSGENISLYTF